MNPLQIHFELDPYYPFSDPSRPAFWLAGLGVLLLIFITSVSYTHLTLPTICSV